MIPFTCKQIYGDKSQKSAYLWEEVVATSRRKGGCWKCFLSYSEHQLHGSAHRMSQEQFEKQQLRERDGVCKFIVCLFMVCLRWKHFNRMRGTLGRFNFKINYTFMTSFTEYLNDAWNNAKS